MLKNPSCLALLIALGAGLAGCATTDENPASPAAPAILEATPVATRSAGDIQKINDLERQLSREQRQCLADKRRLEASLKESQKQSEDLQKKLDALLTIDRDLRNRSRSR